MLAARAVCTSRSKVMVSRNLGGKSEARKPSLFRRGGYSREARRPVENVAKDDKDSKRIDKV